METDDFVEENDDEDEEMEEKTDENSLQRTADRTEPAGIDTVHQGEITVTNDPTQSSPPHRKEPASLNRDRLSESVTSEPELSGRV